MLKIISIIKNKYTLIIGAIAVVVFAFSLVSLNNNKAINTSSTALSTKKIEWGIKRNDNHEQPDLGKVNKNIIDNNNGIAIGNKESKKVYLTFDEGYEAGYTEKILETLKQNEVKACFFITAHFLNTQEDLVKQMIDDGHIVGNHTVNHKSMPDITQEELTKEVMDLHQVIYEKFGYEMKYLRPPKGEFSEKTLKQISQLGYKTVMWSFAYEDWEENKQPDEQKAKNLHNGEIILLHGNSKTNTNVLDSVIKEAINMGYEFKSLDEFEK